MYKVQFFLCLCSTYPALPQRFTSQPVETVSVH